MGPWSSQTAGVSPPASKYTAAAVSFVKYLASPAQQLRFADAFGVMPSRPAVAQEWAKEHTTPIATGTETPNVSAFVQGDAYALPQVATVGFATVKTLSITKSTVLRAPARSRCCPACRPTRRRSCSPNTTRGFVVLGRPARHHAARSYLYRRDQWRQFLRPERPSALAGRWRPTPRAPSCGTG